ncbi:MAG: trigger factor [Chloroflexota bacterium]
MNVQTEKLENHIARLTVEVDLEQLEKAKKKAAKKIARQVNIPGFRKGKAPYRVLANYIGEGAILEEAVEDLGNNVYSKALDEAEILPYTSGELQDFKLDPQPTFIFTVPMQPTVEMNDYTTVRVDYEMPEVEDDDIKDALRRLQEEHALIEESASPAKLGDRITADIHGFYVYDDEDSEDDENTPDDTDDAENSTDESEGDDESSQSEEDDEFQNAPLHQQEAEIYMDEDREPVPGFADAVVGVTPDERREFQLTYPDEEKYGDFAGEEVRFVVQVQKVENVTLPELNDDFAARVTEDEREAGEEAPTLLELRARLRENITKEVEDSYKSEYVESVMDELVDVATFAYPKAMIDNQIDSMIESTAQRFGFSIDDYLRLTQKTMEDIHEDMDYRESAENYIKRSLVMRGILEAENIEVSDGQIAAEIDKVLSQFGEQAETYRSLFDTPEMRDSVTNNLLEQQIIDRIVAIGRGEEPPAPAADAAPDAEANTDQPTADDSEEAEAEVAETDES